MSRVPLLKRYAGDLTRMGASVLLLCVLAVAGFNAVEIWEHQETREEELEELGVIVLILLGTFPVIVWMARRTAKRLLEPLLTIQTGLKEIQSGVLQTRIPVEAEEEELVYLAESLNAAFDAHRHVRAQLERFSGNVSHQLRTPLTAMRTEGELCLRQNRDGEGWRESVARMLESCERTGHLVDQLLLLARVSAHEEGAGFGAVDLREVMEGVLWEYRLVLEDREGAVAVSLPAYPVCMKGNGVWLGEAFRNLLNNALTHVPDGAPLRMELSQEEAVVEWVVEDGGAGMLPDQAGTFDGEAVAGVPRADRSGTGLGLAIVREIVQVHGGRLEVGNGSLGGACVRMVFPGGCVPGRGPAWRDRGV